jgi:methionyl-tRNA formyltransferase
MTKRIVMLTSHCFSTVVLYNYLSRFWTIDRVITENPMRGLALAKRRMKKLGFFRVSGQVLFSAVVVPVLRVLSKKRIKEIKGIYSLDETAIPQEKITHFPSVNDEECITLLKDLDPDIVIVNGTRIISKKVLESTKAVFINMHTGITPQYRGVHGGYWALVNNDNLHCGVTIHQVDKGIDTGSVLYQSLINVTGSDNFVTYPFLQFGEGLPLMRKAIDDSINNITITHKPVNTQSKLWYHPTIWQYLYYRIFRKKK